MFLSVDWENEPVDIMKSAVTMIANQKRDDRWV